MIGSAEAPDRYELLLEMWQRISRTFDLPEILAHLLEVVGLTLPYDAAGVFVLSRFVDLPGTDRSRAIAAMASVGFTPDPGREDPMLKSGKGIIGHVIESGEPVIATDVSLDSRYVAGRAGTRSEVAVPIRSDGRVIGALNLESDRLDAYGEQDARELQFFAAAAAISIEKAILHHQVLEKQHLDHHMALAREVQVSLLPSSAPRLPGYEMDAINLPTMEIGGDYFDYLPFSDGRLGVVVADVSGKGVASALIMATFRAALRIECRRERELHETVAEVNRLLLDSIDPSRYVTAIYGVLDPASGELTYMNCGHTPPFLLRADGGCELLDKGRPALGMPVSVVEEAGKVRLDPGDVLAVYTDGVVEQFAPAGEEYGRVRLEALLRGTAHQGVGDMVKAVVRDTLAFSGRLSFEDDFTLLLLKRNA